MTAWIRSLRPEDLPGNRPRAAVRKGTFNTAVPSGSEFKTINGADSQIFVDRRSDLPGDGTEYVYTMQCKDAGTSGNNYSGDLLPITPVENLTSAVLGDIIMAGTEEETDEALRSRFYETFDVAAFGRKYLLLQK